MRSQRAQERTEGGGGDGTPHLASAERAAQPCYSHAPLLSPPQVLTPRSQRTNERGHGHGWRRGGKSGPVPVHLLTKRLTLTPSQHSEKSCSGENVLSIPAASPAPLSPRNWHNHRATFARGSTGPTLEACGGLGALLEAFSNSAPAALLTSKPVPAKFAPHDDPKSGAARRAEGGRRRCGASKCSKKRIISCEGPEVPSSVVPKVHTRGWLRTLWRSISWEWGLQWMQTP